MIVCAVLRSITHEAIARDPTAFRAARKARDLVGAILFAVVTATSSASAQTDPYHITASEKAACLYDAQRFCLNTYPDEGALLACMKANRTSLTTLCLAAFDAGMKKRHLR